MLFKIHCKFIVKKEWQFNLTKDRASLTTELCRCRNNWWFLFKSNFSNTCISWQ